MEGRQSVWDWATQLKSFQTARLEQLPDIDLYMDQVITLLSKELEPFEVGDERLLTSNMINNYVKGEVLPRPERKKYNREHLVYLLMICRLKSVLTLPQIAEAMKALTEETGIEEVYTGFQTIETQIANSVSDRVALLDGKSDHEKLMAAMEMAILANLSRCAAARLLEELHMQEQNRNKLAAENKESTSSKKEKAKERA